jgi:amino acid transporter
MLVLKPSGAGGFDSTVHISEEARNAKTAVPWAIVSAVISGCVCGFGTFAIRTLFNGSLIYWDIG